MWFLCPQSKLWKWKSLSRVWLFAAPWTVVLGILQARIMEWVAFPFSRRSSQPRDQTQGSHTAGRFFTNWTTKLWQTIFSQDSENSVSYPSCWFTKLLWYSTIEKESLFLLPFESGVRPVTSLKSRVCWKDTILFSHSLWLHGFCILHRGTFALGIPHLNPSFCIVRSTVQWRYYAGVLVNSPRGQLVLGRCSGQPSDDCSRQSKTDSSQRYQTITREFGQPPEMRD